MGKRSGAWSGHCQWIALRFLTTPKMMGKLRRKQPLMKWLWEQCGHYVNSLYLLANKITLIYPLQHFMMHWSDFTKARMLFANWRCQSLRRPKRMNTLQEMPISYENETLLQSEPRSRFRCMGLKWFQQQAKGNSRSAWIEPDKRQPYG